MLSGPIPDTPYGNEVFQRLSPSLTWLPGHVAQKTVTISRSHKSRLATHRSYKDPNHSLILIYRSYESVGQTYIILYLSLHMFEDKITHLFKQTKWYNFIENISIIELKSNLLNLFTPYCFEQYVHMHKLLFTTIKNAQNLKKNNHCWSALICVNL